MHAEVGALGEVLPQQAVGVLVGAALPRTLRSQAAFDPFLPSAGRHPMQASAHLEIVNHVPLISCETLGDEMLRATNEHAMVYQVLDDVLAGGAIPTGVRGTIFSVIDGLRTNGADMQEVRRAESIAINLHRLEWALQRRSIEDAEQARVALKGIAVELLNSRIRTSTS